MLGGDLSLVNEVQQRHTEVAGTVEEEFLLTSTVPSGAENNKRNLDGDADLYLARKKRTMAEQ